MDFSQVRYFLALAETLNFTRAAEACHVTQPTLTKGIKRLEDELGGSLLIRDGKNTRLSELGRVLRSHFERISETRATLQDTAKAITSGEQNELNIGLMCTIGPRVLSHFLESFRQSNPSTMLLLHDVTLETVPDLLLSGALDGAFCARRGQPHEKLHHIKLFTEPMVVAFLEGHRFEQESSVRLSDAVREPYIDRLLCEFRKEINSTASVQHFPMDVVFSSAREDWIQALIADGVGVSILPEYSITEKSLEHRPIVEPSMKRDVEFKMAHGGPKSQSLLALVSMINTYPWADAQRR